MSTEPSTDGNQDEQKAREILDRPSPEERATEELQDELSDIWDILTGTWVTGRLYDRLQERSSAIFRVLEDRLGIEYPECEHCGSRSWGQNPGDPMRCGGCDRQPDEETRKEVNAKWERIAGNTEDTEEA